MLEKNIKDTNIHQPFRPSFTVRMAEEQDTSMLRKFISMLPDYETMIHGKILTDDILNQILFFNQKDSYCILVYKNKSPVGFALYTGNTIIFIGKPDLRMDAFCINSYASSQEMREELFQRLAYVIGEAAQGGLEWWCLMGKSATL